MQQDKKKKVAFVVTRMGEPGSGERKRSKFVIEQFIRPSLGNLDIFLITPFDIENSDSPEETIKYIYKSNVVIADITDHTTNISYEIAAAEREGLPVIKIAQKEGADTYYVNDKDLMLIPEGAVERKRFRKKLKEEVVVVAIELEEQENVLTSMSEKAKMERLFKDEARFKTFQKSITDQENENKYRLIRDGIRYANDPNLVNEPKYEIEILLEAINHNKDKEALIIDIYNVQQYITIYRWRVYKDKHNLFKIIFMTNNSLDAFKDEIIKRGYVILEVKEHKRKFNMTLNILSSDGNITIEGE